MDEDLAIYFIYELDKYIDRRDWINQKPMGFSTDVYLKRVRKQIMEMSTKILAGNVKDRLSKKTDRWLINKLAMFGDLQLMTAFKEDFHGEHVDNIVLDNIMFEFWSEFISIYNIKRELKELRCKPNVKKEEMINKIDYGIKNLIRKDKQIRFNVKKIRKLKKAYKNKDIVWWWYIYGNVRWLIKKWNGDLGKELGEREGFRAQFE